MKRTVHDPDIRESDWETVTGQAHVAPNPPAVKRDKLRVFGGSGNPALAKKIATSLRLKLGNANVERFPDGEILVKLEDDVRGRDCFIVQPTCPQVNENLMELLIFIDSLRRASARRITAVIPYFGYARQDRKSEGRTPITAKLVANLITEAGADRVLTMDLHAEQIQGFFDIPVDHLTAEPVISKHFLELNLKDTVVVSPDVGNMKKANAYLVRLGGELAVIDKRRLAGDQTVASRIVGGDMINGRSVLMFDDMITTAGTVTEAAKLVRSYGASAVYVSATHPVLVGPALDRLDSAGIDKICVTDTIPLREETRQRLPNITVLSVADLMGKAIWRIHRNESISALFNNANRTNPPEHSGSQP